MLNSIFFQILSSWEVIVAIIAFLIILPLTFYITSADKDSTLEFIGIKKRKKRIQNSVRYNSGDGDGRGRLDQRMRDDDQEINNNRDDDEEDKRKYELLKRLKSK